MENQERHTELFDKYVLGTLSKAEEAELSHLVESDAKIKLEFESHKLLVDGIKLARKEELKDYLKEHGKVEYFENIWGPKWRKASIAIVAIFLVAFFTVEYIKKQPINQNPVAKNETNSKNGEEEPSIIDEEIENASNKEITKSPEEKIKEQEIALIETDDVSQFDLDKTEMSRFKDTLIPEVEERELEDLKSIPKYASKERIGKIAQEQKLLDTTLLAFVATIDPSSKKDKDIVAQTQTTTVKKKELKKSRTTSDKTDEVASEDLEEISKESNSPKTINIPIELWQSPIHFKGYQYQKSLKLYGVSLTNIKLISLDNTLYIKIGDQYSAIIKSSEYLPFKFITNTTIIEQLNAY